MEFLDEFAKAIETISKEPEGYAVASKRRGLRRFVEREFRTAILYRYSKKEDLLMVVRVLQLPDGSEALPALENLPY